MQRVGPRGRQPLVVLEPVAAAGGLPEPPRAAVGGGGPGPPPVRRVAIRSDPVARWPGRDDGHGSAAPQVPGGPRVARRCRCRHGVAAEEERGRPERQRDERQQQREFEAPGGAHI